MRNCSIYELLKFIFISHLFDQNILGNILNLKNKMIQPILVVVLYQQLEKFIISAWISWPLLRVFICSWLFEFINNKFEYFLIQTHMLLFNCNLNQISYTIYFFLLFRPQFIFFILAVVLGIQIFIISLFFNFMFNYHFDIYQFILKFFWFFI